MDASFVQVVGDVGRLHSHVGDVDGAGEQEEDGQAWQQQAESHRYGYIQLSGGGEKREVRPWKKLMSSNPVMLPGSQWVLSCRQTSQFTLKTKHSVWTHVLLGRSRWSLYGIRATSWFSCPVGRTKNKWNYWNGVRFPLMLNNGQLLKGMVQPKLKRHHCVDVDTGDIF